MQTQFLVFCGQEFLLNWVSLVQNSAKTLGQPGPALCADCDAPGNTGTYGHTEHKTESSSIAATGSGKFHNRSQEKLFRNGAGLSIIECYCILLRIAMRMPTTWYIEST